MSCVDKKDAVATQKEKPAFWPAARVRRKFAAAKGSGELRRGGSADPEH